MDNFIIIQKDCIYFTIIDTQSYIYNAFLENNLKEVIILQFPTGIRKNYIIKKFVKGENNLIFELENIDNLDNELVILEFIKKDKKNDEEFYMPTSSGLKNVTRCYQIEYKITNKCDGLIKKGLLTHLDTIIKVKNCNYLNELYTFINNFHLSFN